jgi:hypothetical protein
LFLLFPGAHTATQDHLAINCLDLDLIGIELRAARKRALNFRFNVGWIYLRLDCNAVGYALYTQ